MSQARFKMKPRDESVDEENNTGSQNLTIRFTTYN
jgi:hypothetical protein